jgi:hypothetical protein
MFVRIPPAVAALSRPVRRRVAVLIELRLLRSNRM